MKYLPTLICALILSVIALAQEAEPQNTKNDENASAATQDPDRLKPMEKDWGFTFNLTGLISDIQLEGNQDLIGNDILFFRHYLKDDLALRLGLGINYVNTNTVRKDSLQGAFVEFDSTYNRFDFSISGGIEKHLGDFKRLDPYIGGQLMLEFRGRENYDWNEVRQESASSSTTITNERTVEGGTNFGLIGLIGFNYFIAKNIALGGEYHYGAYILSTGGNYSEFRTETPSSGTSISTKKEGTLEESSTGVTVNSTANIVFSVFF